MSGGWPAGLTATITSVEKVERNLSSADAEHEWNKGYTEDEIRWEYRVEYTVFADGREYTYTDTKRYRQDGSNKPVEGDTDVINYAIKDGKFIPHPETQGINGPVVGGWILVILAVLSAGLGVFLRK